jgi:hypothetical protein
VSVTRRQYTTNHAAGYQTLHILISHNEQIFLHNNRLGGKLLIEEEILLQHPTKTAKVIDFCAFIAK